MTHPNPNDASQAAAGLPGRIAAAGGIVTGDTGPHPIPRDARSLVAVTADGTVLVLRGRAIDPVVQHALRNLRGRVHLREPHVEVGIDLLQSLYATAPRAAAQTDRTQTEKLVHDLLRRAQADNASDIHIRTSTAGTRIELRIDGDLELIEEHPSADPGTAIMNHL